MSMLTFYINRAGSRLSWRQKNILTVPSRSFEGNTGARDNFEIERERSGVRSLSLVIRDHSGMVTSGTLRDQIASAELFQSAGATTSTGWIGTINGGPSGIMSSFPRAAAIAIGCPIRARAAVAASGTASSGLIMSSSSLSHQRHLSIS
jgi:Protein of unknown function (DUF3175)